jgi:hypothetical protein
MNMSMHILYMYGPCVHKRTRRCTVHEHVHEHANEYEHDHVNELIH